MNSIQTYVFHELYGQCSWDELVSILMQIRKCTTYESALNKA